MASSIASPVPRAHSALPSSVQTLQSNEDGRNTPLPLYEKNAEAVPFTLELQEDKDDPGQFQLVVNINSQQQTAWPGSSLAPATSKKLVTRLQDVSNLGYDVSPLYHPPKSSAPASPRDEPQGWSDLDGVPPGFLEKVAPDCEPKFTRSDTTASTQSKKLSVIKARIKKSGKGFVVRLLKGSNADAETSEVEVHLDQNVKESDEGAQQVQQPAVELPAEMGAVELDASPSVTASPATTANEQTAMLELPRKYSNPSGPTSGLASLTHMPQRLERASVSSQRTSVLEEGWLSDAETLRSDIPSITNRMDDFSDIEPLSRYSSVMPTRSASLFSIVKTPTRGLSVVGPVRRVEKGNRARGKGKVARSGLNRSGAHKSIRRHSPRTSTQGIPHLGVSEGHSPGPSTTRDASHHLQPLDISSDEGDSNKTWPQAVRERHPTKARSSSADQSSQPASPKTNLRLETDVPRATSANSSPDTRRRRSPRFKKSIASSSAVDIAGPSRQGQLISSDELYRALAETFGSIEDEEKQAQEQKLKHLSIPRIEEPENAAGVGNMQSVPSDYETRCPPPAMSSPMIKFWGLALSALSQKAVEGLSALRARYGTEPRVPAGHVRVRWTCSCGSHLYDDFIEKRPGAARWLETYLNRPLAHTPTSPSSSRTSTKSSMDSIFDSHSRSSTLTTPSSTYNGISSWGQSGSSSKHSPTRLRSNPFSVRIDAPIEESWLLTCANEGRFTPKIVHLDVNSIKIRSDKDLALALREHYESLNRRWWKWARLRGLASIEFVQFEVHGNRFADIRATPSMPPVPSTSDKLSSPSHHPYNFEPVDLIPPVGSTYLLHLFQHPSDYDNELVTYLRSPKRTSRLQFGMGWGVHMVEGFMAQRVWAMVLAGFGLGSAVFAVCWAAKTGDIQGAFGMASWVVAIAGLVAAAAQAWLE